MLIKVIFVTAAGIPCILKDHKITQSELHTILASHTVTQSLKYKLKQRDLKEVNCVTARMKLYTCNKKREDVQHKISVICKLHLSLVLCIEQFQ